MRSLRLDEAAEARFNDLVGQMALSGDELHAFAAEEVGKMEDARYDQLVEAQERASANATAVVHFLAPRILRLRDGEAKRKWRSFLTKFQKDQRRA